MAYNKLIFPFLDKFVTYKIGPAAKLVATNVAAWPFPTNTQDNLHKTEWPKLPAQPQVDCRVVYILPNEMFPGNLGATVVYRKCSKFKNARMVEVAVIYCSPLDTFTKSIGRKLALESFEDGNTIKFPIRTTDQDLPWNLKVFFAL